MQQPNPGKPGPAQRLLALRIIWGALLMGQIMYLVIVLAIGKNLPPPDPRISQLLLYIAVAMLAVLVPTGYALRASAYRKSRDDDGLVGGGAYVAGNILFLA